MIHLKGGSQVWNGIKLHKADSEVERVVERPIMYTKQSTQKSPLCILKERQTCKKNKINQIPQG